MLCVCFWLYLYVTLFYQIYKYFFTKHRMSFKLKKKLYLEKCYLIANYGLLGNIPFTPKQKKTRKFSFAGLNFLFSKRFRTKFGISESLHFIV